MATHWIWTGVPTHDSVRIRARIDGTSGRVAYTTQESLANLNYSGTVTAASGIIDVTLEGLTPGSTYHFVVEDSGTLDTSWRGRFRCWPSPVGEPVSMRIASWSCAGLRPRFPGAADYVSNHPVLDKITDWAAPDMLVQTGDLHYRNIGVDDPTMYREAYEAVLDRTDTPRLSRHLAMTPNVYVWDDHDFGPNDSDSGSPGKAAAAQVYREYVPHDELPDPNGAIYHARQIGRVLHVFSDTRFYRSNNNVTDGPNKTMLGALQIEWFSNLLANTSAQFLVWYMPSQWLGVSNDSWSSFQYERNRLVNILSAPGGDPEKSWLGRMIQVSGDVHALAMDDGTGNRWGHFPVYVCASVDSDAGQTQTGLYKMDGVDVPTAPGRNQYGIISIEDTGDTIEVDASLYISKWRRFHHKWTYRINPEQDLEPFDAVDVEAFSVVDWGEGYYHGSYSGESGPQVQPLIGFSVNRELATDIPDDMRQASGLSAAEADFEVAAPSGALFGHFSPWVTPLQYLKAPTELYIEANGERYPQFVGSTDRVGSSSRNVVLDATSLDYMADLDVPVQLPAFGGQMGSLTATRGLNPGLRPEWVVENVLSQTRFGALWPVDPDAIIYASMAGSTMATVGNWEWTIAPQSPTEEPTFVRPHDLPYPVPIKFGARYTPGVAGGEGAESVQATGWTIGAISGDAPVSRSGQLRLDMYISVLGQTAVRVYIKHESNNDSWWVEVETQVDGVSQGTIRFDDIEPGPWWVSLTPGNGNMGLRLMQPGEADRLGSLPTGVNQSQPTVLTVFHAWTRDAGEDNPIEGPATLGVQVIAGAKPLDELPVFEPGAASIALPSLQIDTVPAYEDATAREILRDLAEAELGGFWFDEEGRPVFRSRSDLRVSDGNQIPVRSETSLIDPGSWSTDVSQIRSRVEVPVAQVKARTADDDWIDVWQADQVFSIPPRGTLDIVVDLDIPAGGLASILWAGGNEGSRMRLNRGVKGTGTELPASSANRGKVLSLGPTKARITWTNPYNYAVHMVDKEGNPYLYLAARWTVVDSDPIYVVRDTGARGTVLRMDVNPWRQTETDAKELATWLSQEAASPRPYLDQVKVAFDPRIRLGSIIRFVDLDIYGIDMPALVRGVSIDANAGGITQTLSIQPLRLTLGEVDRVWEAGGNRTLGDIDRAYEGRTMSEFDASPLENRGTNA